MDEALDPQPYPVRQALARYRQALAQRWGTRLVDMRLFGSRARNEADAESDVDVCVVLDEVAWRDRCEIINAAADAGFEFGVLISPTVFDLSTWERWKRQRRPLVVAIETEGIAL